MKKLKRRKLVHYSLIFSNCGRAAPNLIPASEWRYKHARQDQHKVVTRLGLRCAAVQA